MQKAMNQHKNLEARQSLYCVWIAAIEQPNAPLVSVWIDPAMRAFEPELQRVKCGAPMASSVGHGCDDESTGDAVIDEPPLRVHIPLMSASLE
jgi:hypothetical protein